MKYERRRGSRHIEDRRGQRSARRGASGGMGLPISGKLGLPALLLILALTFFGGDLLGGGGLGIDPGVDIFGGAAPEPQPGETFDPGTEQEYFVNFVYEDVQDFWDDRFAANDQRYAFATLVLYEQGTSTGCGYGQSAVGPFYCPADQNVYVDLSFFDQLASRFGAPGDFAQAYVIAHEVAHHVQNVLGVSAEVRRRQQQEPDQANELSVRLELQADCLAGVWAHSVYERDILETGDLQEGLDAAAAVGDDTIQKMATGRVSPESWTHGSSEQRMTWFRTGYDSGDASRCDTFA